MKLTLEEIAKIVDGKLIGDSGIAITGASSLSDAGSADITFFADKKLASLLSVTKAGAILFPNNVDYEQLKDKNLILVANPYLAFSKILTIIDNERLSYFKAGISSKATVSQTAKIGQNILIGDNVVIEDNVVIGDNTKILPNVYIGSNTIIGNDCLIYPNVTIRNNIKIGNACIFHPGDRKSVV